MPLAPDVHAYLTSYSSIALENTPRIIGKALGGYSKDDPVWDSRPDPDRFSLKEVIAHMADWNDIYIERLNRTLNEETPDLPNCDEGQIAIDRNYKESNPVESLARFAEGRVPLVSLVKETTPTDWDRMANRVGVGPLNLGEQIQVIMGHDAYHIRQVLDYTDKASRA